jgi:hypothetical protein
MSAKGWKCCGCGIVSADGRKPCECVTICAYLPDEKGSRVWDDCSLYEDARDSRTRTLLEENASSQEEIARLRKALEPFGSEAEAWVGYDETEPLTEGWLRGPATQLNVGHLRSAARALASQPVPEHGGEG